MRAERRKVNVGVGGKGGQYLYKLKAVDSNVLPEIRDFALIFLLPFAFRTS